MDKLLGKVLNQAPSSFIYKMLRKKNIKLNEKRAEGKEILAAGDRVQIYLSDETYDKFHTEKNLQISKGQDQESKGLESTRKGSGQVSKSPGQNQKRKEQKNGAFPVELLSREIIYEDEDIMIINKPAGVLSQKAKPEDDSINEQMLRYLLEQGKLTNEQMVTFTPSVCNRLDRNTSGLVLAGISLQGSQELSRMLRDRSLEKYYLTLVYGEIQDAMEITAYLKKDENTNRVSVWDQPMPGAQQIQTQYVPLMRNKDYTLLEVKLITGKTHQIRAHLAHLGHPVLGDAKYGKKEVNQKFRQQFGIHNQFLHAYRVRFPKLDGPLTRLSETEYKAPLPGKCNEAIRQLWEVDLNEEEKNLKQKENTTAV